MTASMAWAPTTLYSLQMVLKPVARSEYHEVKVLSWAFEAEPNSYVRPRSTEKANEEYMLNSLGHR